MKKNAKNNAVTTANKNESIEANNAHVRAVKENGFVHLYLSVVGCSNISIKVNDFGGTETKKAKKLTFKVYKCLGGK